jgi:hypothetical protein
LPPPPLPGTGSGTSPATPARPSGAAPEGLGTARFSKALELKKRPTRRVWALVQLHPPPTPKPTTPTSQRLTPPSKHTGHWARLVRNMGHRSRTFARARCPFSPLLRPYSYSACRQGSARVVGSHTGQFSCFGPRSCFIAPVLGIPNGFWPLNRAVGDAVGRAYIRETVPTCAEESQRAERQEIGTISCVMSPWNSPLHNTPP